MAINPLETLIENTSAISDNISPAKAAYILSQLLEKTGYDERTQNIVEEEVSPDDQGEAIQTLSEIIGSVNAGKSYEEAVITAFEVEALVEEVEQTVLPLAGDRLTVATDIIEEVVTSIEERIPHSQQNIEDIREHVIPFVLSELRKEGITKNELNKAEYTKFYESDKSIVIQTVSLEAEHLTIDRKTPQENELLRVLEATRESPEEKFDIIDSKMTPSEINRFKEVIAQLEAQRKTQKVQKNQQEELG